MNRGHREIRLKKARVAELPVEEGNRGDSSGDAIEKANTAGLSDGTAEVSAWWG